MNYKITVQNSNRNFLKEITICSKNQREAVSTTIVDDNINMFRFYRVNPTIDSGWGLQNESKFQLFDISGAARTEQNESKFQFFNIYTEDLRNKIENQTKYIILENENEYYFNEKYYIINEDN